MVQATWEAQKVMQSKPLGGIFWSGSTELRKTTKQVGKKQYKGIEAGACPEDLSGKNAVQTESFT